MHTLLKLIGAHCGLQIHKSPLPQPAVWLYQTTTAESVGGAFRRRVQVHSSPVSVVLQEGTQ